MKEITKLKVSQIKEMISIYQETDLSGIDKENIELMRNDLSQKRIQLEEAKKEYEEELSVLFDEGANQIDIEVQNLQNDIESINDLIDSISDLFFSLSNEIGNITESNPINKEEPKEAVDVINNNDFNEKEDEIEEEEICKIEPLEENSEIQKDSVYMLIEENNLDNNNKPQIFAEFVNEDNSNEIEDKNVAEGINDDFNENQLSIDFPIISVEEKKDAEQLIISRIDNALNPSDAIYKSEIATNELLEQINKAFNE